jgi:hypothetical protein
MKVFRGGVCDRGTLALTKLTILVKYIVGKVDVSFMTGKCNGKSEGNAMDS